MRKAILGVLKLLIELIGPERYFRLERAYESLGPRYPSPFLPEHKAEITYPIGMQLDTARIAFDTHG